MDSPLKFSTKKIIQTLDSASKTNDKNAFNSEKKNAIFSSKEVPDVSCCKEKDSENEEEEPKQLQKVVKRRKSKSKTINNTGNFGFKFGHMFKNTGLKSCQKREQNKSNRDYMEDFTLIIDSFNKDISKHLYCLFDGHGGDQVAKSCCEILPGILAAQLNNNPFDFDVALKNSFPLLEKEIKKSKINNVGCTATVVLICNKFLLCANVGDSTCVLITEKGFEKLSIDDKVTNPSEIERIKKKGGVIEDDRVGGIIAVTRSIGDFDLKNKGLICEPHITKILIEHTHKFLVIASDGIWDVITPEEVFKISSEVTDVDLLGEKLVQEALKKGSDDNISCIVVELNKSPVKKVCAENKKNT